MKYKMLSAVIATALLVGCGADDPVVAESYTLKAYDPAVANMDATYDCGTVSGKAEAPTDGYGIAKITNSTVLTSPQLCTYKFIARSNSVDMSNGKSMAGVTYTIPLGMAVNGALVTASPLSTLLAKKLNGAAYSRSAASQILTDLGLGDLLNKGLSVSEIFLNTEAAVGKLTGADKSLLLATTAVVSDVVKSADSGASADDVTKAAKSIADSTVAKYPLYPSSNADGTGAAIFLEIPASSVAAAVADPTAPVTLPPAQEAKPVDPAKPPTGGTGGTGGAGSDDGTGA